MCKDHKADEQGQHNFYFSAHGDEINVADGLCNCFQTSEECFVLFCRRVSIVAKSIELKEGTHFVLGKKQAPRVR